VDLLLYWMTYRLLRNMSNMAGPLSHVVSPATALGRCCRHVDRLLVRLLLVLSWKYVHLSIVVHLKLPVEGVVAKLLKKKNMHHHYLHVCRCQIKVLPLTSDQSATLRT